MVAIDRYGFQHLANVGGAPLAGELGRQQRGGAGRVTVIVAAVRIGWDVLQPCLVAGIAVMLAAAAFLLVVFHMPTVLLAMVGLWSFWVFVLYEAMVVSRMIGLTYFRHADAMAWFQYLPRWGLSPRRGRIYSNS